MCAMYSCDKCENLVDKDRYPCEVAPDGCLICPACADDDRCPECGEVAEWVEETFDYSGTHCTNGRGGVHHTGNYVTKCCGVSDD